MRRSSPASLLAMFLLGACTTAVVQSAAAPSAEPSPASPTPAIVTATVIELDAAPSATAPNGKATITHLARGHHAYLGLLRMDAGAAVPRHRDPTEEYIHVLEGGGTMQIDGATHELRAGTTVYMPAHAEVSFENGPQPLRALQVFAGPEPAAKYDAWQARR